MPAHFKNIIEGTSVLFTLSACMVLSGILLCALSRVGRGIAISSFALLGVVSYVASDLFVTYVADPKHPNSTGAFWALLFVPSGPYFGNGLFVLYTIFPWSGCVFFGCALGILAEPTKARTACWAECGACSCFWCSFF